MLRLGCKARDKITGFEGIITGRATYLYGCDQYGIVARVKKGMAPESSQWFDEGRIEVIGKGILPEQVQVDVPGGPQRDAP